MIKAISSSFTSFETSFSLHKVLLSCSGIDDKYKDTFFLMCNENQGMSCPRGYSIDVQTIILIHFSGDSVYV